MTFGRSEGARQLREMLCMYGKWSAVSNCLNCMQVLHEVKTLAKGVTGVPFFIVDDRYSLSGAQDADTFLKVFEKL